MTTVQEEDAWRMVMAAGAVLSGRVSLVETPLGMDSMATQYEWIDVKVYDPTSHAFAQLPTSSGRGCGLNYTAYARSTRAALGVWAGITRSPGFSAHENAAFWVRAMRQLTPHSHGRESDAPSFLDAPGARFPRFRLTFVPKDCYDEDQHELSDAVGWINTFCNAFFDCENANSMSELEEYANHLGGHSERTVPIELVFRAPVLRTHGPMGSVLQQHRGFIANARKLASQLTAKSNISSHDCTAFNVTGCRAMLRGTVRSREFKAIAPFFDCGSPLRVSELCLELDEDLATEELRQAIETSGIDTVVTNVSRASSTSLERFFATLKDSPSIRTLRLFNAFVGTPAERRDKWRQLSQGVVVSRIQELVLERVQLGEEDIAAMREDIQDQPTRKLTAIIVKPVAGSSVSTGDYVDLIKVLGPQLTHVDLSTLCWQPADVDALLSSCPHLRSLRLAQVDGLVDSRVFTLLRQPSCPLASLSLSCSEDEARALANILADQPLDVALTSSHLTELSLSVEAAGDGTSKALLHMLDTNHSLRFFHLKQRTIQLDATAIQKLAVHHNRQLVHKLPMGHKVAFLSVLDQSSEHTALQRFDTGIASEILVFAGHAVRRQLHCIQ